ncbi:MAG: hypothetical protein NWE89_05390 [Candidatus Bathyarchaeota archaeon]|nr:hypothetical protein [Candidatus Bathyarchaeota archaeon]
MLGTGVVASSLDEGKVREVTVELVDEDVLRSDIEAAYCSTEGDIYGGLAESRRSFEQDPPVI